MHDEMTSPIRQGKIEHTCINHGNEERPTHKISSRTHENQGKKEREQGNEGARAQNETEETFHRNLA